MIKYILIASLANFASTAIAETATGNKVHEFCQSEKLLVTGYVMGLAHKSHYDAMAMFSFSLIAVRGEDSAYIRKEAEYQLSRVKGYCAPEGSTIGQMVDVFCSYLSVVPADRHKPSAELFNTALTKAWPCKR